MKIYTILKGSKFPRLIGSVILVDTGDLKILVDCGSVETRAILRYELHKKGLSPEDIDYLILTHCHFDHIENVELFTSAKIVVSNEELIHIESLINSENKEAWLNNNYEIIKPYYIREIIRRVKKYRDSYNNMFNGLDLISCNENYKIGPGIDVMHTPGHTPGHISLRIKTDFEIWIAGDSITSYDELLNRNTNFCYNYDLYCNSLEQICKNADCIIPAHGEKFTLRDLEMEKIENLVLG